MNGTIDNMRDSVEEVTIENKNKDEKVDANTGSLSRTGNKEPELENNAPS